MNRDFGQTAPSRCFAECEREQFQQRISELEERVTIRTEGINHLHDELDAAGQRIAELDAENNALQKQVYIDTTRFKEIEAHGLAMKAENAKLLEWYRAAIIDVGELVVEAMVFKDLEGRYVAAQYQQTNEIAELKAANKQLLGDLEIARLRLEAAWEESDRRGAKLNKLNEGIHDELWWQLLGEEPPG